MMVNGGQPTDTPYVEHNEHVHIAEEVLLAQDSDEQTAQTVIQDITEVAVAEENRKYTVALGVFCLILVLTMVACFVARRNKMRIDSMTDQALQLSGENIGTESPRAQVHESSEHLESVENDDEKVGLSKSK